MTRANVLARGTSGVGRKLDLWQSSFERATASAMALEKGWMSEEFAGVEPPSRPLPAIDDVSPLWVDASSSWSGRDWQADAFREGGNIAPIWSRADGADTAVVALTWVDEYQAIFARADSHLHDVGDLRGKRLGLPLDTGVNGFPGAVALRGLVTALGLAGIRPKHVSFVDTAGEESVREAREARGRGDGGEDDDQIEALLSGEVDAIFLRSRIGSEARGDVRLRELVNLTSHPDPLVRINNATLRPLTVDRAFLHAHPDLVVRYLTVLLRTAAWAESHHDEVVRLLSSEIGGLSAREVLDVYGPDVHRSFTPALTPSHVRGLEEQKNFLRDWNFLTADFSVTNWIIPEPLAEAQKRARRQPPIVDERESSLSAGSPLVGASRGAGVAVDPFLRERGW